jgi:hypothetical protein
VAIPEEVDNAVILTRYAVQTRYPGLYPPLTEGDWQEAVDLAAGVLAWASIQVSSGAPGAPPDRFY